MAFYKSENELSQHPFAVHGDGKLCAFCGESLVGPLVVYDMQLEPGSLEGLAMHRDCAFAMAQRMILDAWPNRRVGELMACDR